MRMLWRNFLALSLGMVATAAFAQEGVWKPVASSRPGAPAALMGAPVASARPAAPAAALGRPVAIATSRPGGAVVRGSSAELIPALPGLPAPPGPPVPVNPIGPANPSGVYPGLHSWRKADDGLVQTSLAGNALPAPTPANGPMLGGPAVNAMPAGPAANGHPFVPHNYAPPAANHAAPAYVPVPNAPGVPSLYATSPGCGPGCCAATQGAAHGVAPASSCGCNSHVCPPGNIWYVSAEYLAWAMKGDATPPLVSTFNGPVQVPLFGGEGLGSSLTSGVRGTAGVWFSESHYWGFEVSGFRLGNQNDRFNATSLNGSPVLVRPFVDVGPFTADRLSGAIVPNMAVGMPAFERLADRELAGSIDIDRHSSFWGIEGNFKRGILCCDNAYLDLLFGYRTLGLDEGLTITETLTTTTLTPRQSFRVQDRFDTSNRFYGGQVGLDGEYRLNRWSFGARAKVALGNTQQMAELSGSTTRRIDGGAPMTLPGGLLVQSTNSGRHFREEFSVVPEFAFTLGYQMSSACRLTVGYNFLYWSNVLRPGGAIDTGVNTAYLPFAPQLPAGALNPPRPAFPGTTSDFWAQGLTLGLEFKW